MKKRNLREYYVELRNAVGEADMMFGEITQDEMLGFIDSRIEQLDKKRATAANGERKMTEKQLENEKLKGEIYELIPNGKDNAIAVRDMLKTFSCFEGMEISGQRVTALLNQLVNAEMIVAEKVKGQNAYYKA